MVIVKFCGALGNQLFQYALYKKIATLGGDVKADLSAFKNGVEHRCYYLDALGIRVSEASPEEIDKFTSSKKSNWLINMIGNKKYFIDNPTYCYNEKILRVKNGYLDGYWQCPKYFDDVKDAIIGEIEFPELTDEMKILEERICAGESVSIHVRMGDYLKLKDKYGDICTKEYYSKAIQYIQENVADPVFFGFSDDPEKAREFIDVPNITWITDSSEEQAYHDLNLMRKCKHSILANSSFSWWGAYLGENRSRIVIAPSKWINKIDRCEIWCDNWVKL